MKAPFLLDLFVRVGLGTPLVVEGLPDVLWHPLVPVVAYLLPVIAVPVGLVRLGRWAAWSGGLGALCAFALLVHVAAYNDATFVTCLWAGLWIAWLATQGKEEGVAWGPRLAQGVVSLVFLGGALGKLTPEYISGDVLYHVYFLQRETLFYPWLRATLDPEMLRTLATWFSWSVIALEAALATCVFWKPRVALWAAALACTAIVAGSTIYLASVMAPLVGVCIGGLLLRGTAAPGRTASWLRARLSRAGRRAVAAPV
ncbi:MAG: hypothetical protein AAF594_12915 [Bacteroidota bacterium]